IRDRNVTGVQTCALPILEALRQRIQFTGISDVKMEEGSMRVDTNISIRPIGSDKFGTKTEMKNINSFNYVRKALAFEEKRHQKEIGRASCRERVKSRRAT